MTTPARLKYLEKPKLCILCGDPIPFERKEGTICSHSCKTANYTLYRSITPRRKTRVLPPKYDASNTELTLKEYRYLSRFTFEANDYPNLPGYEDLIRVGRYKRYENPLGLVGDHILSRVWGWRLGVPPSIISHPANCQYIPFLENCSKGGTASITLEELYERIWCFNEGIELFHERKIILPR